MRGKLFVALWTGLSLILFGCGYNVARLPNFDRDIESTNRAIVVVKLNNFDYLDLRRAEAGVSQEGTKQPALRKLFVGEENTGADTGSKQLALTKEYRIFKTKHLYKPFNYAQSMYSIEPGLYYISFLAINSDKGHYFSANPGIKQNGEIVYGAYNIKPGEVLYLGDVECQWKSTNNIRKLRILDSLAEVKHDLQDEGYNELADKIVNAQFIPSGVNINSLN